MAGSLAMAVTSQILLSPIGPTPLYTIARLTHAVLGLAVLPIALVWHLFEGLGPHRAALVPAFHPWADPSWKRLPIIIPVALVTTCLVLNGLPMAPPWRDLVAERIDPVDGSLDSIDFGSAQPMAIELANGAGHDKGRVRITLQALHDGNELFVRARWPDREANRRYMPWKKTERGWEHLVTSENDESLYYEDKFALIFPTVASPRFERFGCAATCHVGSGSAFGRSQAYGYKGHVPEIDVWHWKATRTSSVGQIDDKYWSKIDFEAKDVGRHGDPKERGGYTKNVSEDHTHPAMLPAEPEAVREGIIPADRAVEYTEDLAAAIPAGTIIPGMVAEAVVGDRGDVSCVARHSDGQWVLLIRRELDTGSPHDAKFAPGGRYTFGCAAFDCSSKRHAYNHLVYRLELKP